MRILSFILLMGSLPSAVAEQKAQYGCKTANGSYQIEFTLNPNGESIRYVYGGATRTSGCLANFLDGAFRLNIPIEQGSSLQGACGVIEDPPGSRDFKMVVTTMSIQSGAFKGTDRRYLLNCHFNGPVDLNVSTPDAILLSDNSVASIPFNNLTYIESKVSFDLVSQATGLPLTQVQYKENVRLKITIDSNYHNSQSMLIRDCYATGSNRGIVPIIGNNGCSDPGSYIIPQGTGFIRVDMTTAQTESFEMFLIPGATNVVFTCSVTLCPDLTCSQSCVAPGRKRRSADEIASGEVFAIIRMGNHSSSGTGSLTVHKSDEYGYCTNWPYLVAIAALALVLLVSLGFGMLLFSKRPRDTRVGDFKEKPLA